MDPLTHQLGNVLDALQAAVREKDYRRIQIALYHTDKALRTYHDECRKEREQTQARIKDMSGDNCMYDGWEQERYLREAE